MITSKKKKLESYHNHAHKKKTAKQTENQQLFSDKSEKSSHKENQLSLDLKRKAKTENHSLTGAEAATGASNWYKTSTVVD